MVQTNLKFYLATLFFIVSMVCFRRRNRPVHHEGMNPFTYWSPKHAFPRWNARPHYRTYSLLIKQRMSYN